MELGGKNGNIRRANFQIPVKILQLMRRAIRLWLRLSAEPIRKPFTCNHTFLVETVCQASHFLLVSEVMTDISFVAENRLPNIYPRFTSIKGFSRQTSLTSCHLCFKETECLIETCLTKDKINSSHSGDTF